MTPLGHAAVSYVLGRSIPRWPMWGFLIGGVLPDIDFLLLSLESFNDFHRTATHNVFFVSLIAIVGAACLIGRPIRDRLTFAAAALIAGGLHLLIDSFMDANGSNGIGVAILWPLAGGMFSPFNLLDPAIMGEGWSDIGGGFRALRHELPWEAPFYLVAVVLLVQSRLARPRAASSQ